MLSTLKTQTPGDLAYWSLGFLFFVGMHYFQSHPSGDGLQLSFNAFSWIPISFFIGFSLLHIVHRSSIRYSQLTLGLLLACALLFIPAIFPASLDVTSLGRFYGLVAGLLVFIGLQQLVLTDVARTQLLFLILVAVLIEAVIGWAQYFAWLPENFMGYSSDQRITWGIFRQPNVMASFMATGVVLSAYLLPAYIAISNRKGNFFATICLLTPLLAVPVILLLNSRVGWLGLLIGSVLMLPYLLAKGGRHVTRSWVLMLLLGAILGLLFLANSPSGFGPAVAKVQVDPVRLKMYPVVIRLFLDNALFGVGYGNFESSFNLFAASQYQAGLAEPSGVTNLHHPHNELLFWAAEGGVVALAGLLLAAFLVFRSILRCERGVRLALIGLLFPIVLHTQTEYPFYHSAVHWIVFVVLLYLVDTQGNPVKTKTLNSTLIIGTAGVLIPTATSIFMATTLYAASVLNRFESVPGTSPEVLSSIVNPMVWRDRLIFTVRGNLMYAALARGDDSQVQPFIDLVNERIKTQPRWERYQDLIFAYDILRDNELAEEVFSDAEYRFPTKEFFRLDESAFRVFTYSVDNSVNSEANAGNTRK